MTPSVCTRCGTAAVIVALSHRSDPNDKYGHHTVTLLYYEAELWRMALVSEKKFNVNLNKSQAFAVSKITTRAVAIQPPHTSVWPSPRVDNLAAANTPQAIYDLSIT